MNQEELQKHADNLYAAGLGDDDVVDALEQLRTKGVPAGGPPTGLQPNPRMSLIDQVQGFLAKEGPAMTGAGVGAAVMAPVLPPFGAVAGAALGAAGAEGYRRAFAQSTGREQPQGPLQTAQGLLRTGVSYGAGEAVAGGLGAGYRAFKGALSPVAAQATTAMTAVPLKYSKAAYADPAILGGKQTIAEAGAAYGAIPEKAGLIGGREAAQLQTGKRFVNAGDSEKAIETALDALEAGRLDAQTALVGVQQTNRLLQLAKYGNPEQRVNQSVLMDAKTRLETHLESQLPGFKQASRDYFAANAREQFAQPIPLNRNQSPNALRGLGMLGMAWQGLTHLDPGLLAAATLGSPWVHGTALRGAYMAQRAVSPAFRYGAAPAAGAAINRR